MARCTMARWHDESLMSHSRKMQSHEAMRPEQEAVLQAAERQAFSLSDWSTPV